MAIKKVVFVVDRPPKKRSITVMKSCIISLSKGARYEKKRFSLEQIVSAIKQQEAGLTVAEISRKMGVAEGTFYAWKKKYSGLESDQVRELKQLQAENEKLKKIVADLTLDKVMLQDLNSRKW